MKSMKHLKGRLVRHLKRIALYALPRQPDSGIDLLSDISTESSISIPSSVSARLEKPRKFPEIGNDDCTREHDEDRTALSYLTNKKTKDYLDLGDSDLAQAGPSDTVENGSWCGHEYFYPAKS